MESATNSPGAKDKHRLDRPFAPEGMMFCHGCKVWTNVGPIRCTCPTNVYHRQALYNPVRDGTNRTHVYVRSGGADHKVTLN